MNKSIVLAMSLLGAAAVAADAPPNTLEDPRLVAPIVSVNPKDPELAKKVREAALCILTSDNFDNLDHNNYYPGIKIFPPEGTQLRTVDFSEPDINVTASASVNADPKNQRPEALSVVACSQGGKSALGDGCITMNSENRRDFLAYPAEFNEAMANVPAGGFYEDYRDEGFNGETTDVVIGAKKFGFRALIDRILKRCKGKPAK